MLQENYIAPNQLQPSKMVLGAIRGLVDALDDPYTTFMDAEENKGFRQFLSGDLQGIGAELVLKDGRVIVVTPLRGSPAEKAGLMPDDVITKVDGKEIEGETLTEVVGRIRGTKGSRVSLTIVRNGQEKKFTITRDEIHIPSVESHVEKRGRRTIGVITLNQFGEHSVQEVQRAIQEFPSSMDGLVLDLRSNGGGLLEGAVEIASMFLRQGEVVAVEGHSGEPSRHYVSGKPLLPDIPLVILINNGSASASEILAGALQDHERATIVGEKSFGKGTVQEVIDLPGGSSLRVTIARWLTPDGRDLSKEGVTPDVVVERTAEDVEAERDPQMEKALEVVTK
jgi:carboxyl-terminal processing protease